MDESSVGSAPPSSRVLSEAEDAFGNLLLDRLAGGADDLIFERDDGYVGPALPAEVFFAEHREWPAEEQRVFELVRGRVLDVGCGAGRHSLEAQRRGLRVVALDISPGAADVCRRRGVRDVRLLPLSAVDARLGVFDTVLMMCGNFGLVGTAGGGRGDAPNASPDQCADREDRARLGRSVRGPRPRGARLRGAEPRARTPPRTGDDAAPLQGTGDAVVRAPERVALRARGPGRTGRLAARPAPARRAARLLRGPR